METETDNTLEVFPVHSAQILQLKPRPEYTHHVLPPRHKVVDDRHWLYSTSPDAMTKTNVIRNINVFGWGSAMAHIVQHHHLEVTVKGKQNKYGLEYSVGSPFNCAQEGL